MVTTNDIGGSSGNTWACVRAPLWNATGFTNPPFIGLPWQSNNWSPGYTAPIDSHSYGYSEPVTVLRKAFPVTIQNNTPESPAGSFSTCLGLYHDFGYSNSVYLTLGTGIAIGDFRNREVLSYFPFYPAPPNPARAGYDYETTKAHLIGATVIISYETAVSTTVESVVITADLFPSDMYDSDNTGVYFKTEENFITSFYISSVTLP